jgi:hypothetical protein
MQISSRLTTLECDRDRQAIHQGKNDRPSFNGFPANGGRLQARVATIEECIGAISVRVATASSNPTASRLCSKMRRAGVQPAAQWEARSRGKRNETSGRCVSHHAITECQRRLQLAWRKLSGLAHYCCDGVSPALPEGSRMTRRRSLTAHDVESVRPCFPAPVRLFICFCVRTF